MLHSNSYICLCILIGLWLTVSRVGMSEVPQKKSPATPRTAHQLKTPNSDADSVSSPNAAKKTPKDRSPKVIECRSPHSPISEVFEVNSCLELITLSLIQLFKHFINPLPICICICINSETSCYNVIASL